MKQRGDVVNSGLRFGKHFASMSSHVISLHGIIQNWDLTSYLARLEIGIHNCNLEKYSFIAVNVFYTIKTCGEIVSEIATNIFWEEETVEDMQVSAE